MSLKTRLLLPAVIASALTLISAISFARAAEIVAAGDLAITAAWARATPPGADTAAAYVTIENRGEADDRMAGAASPAARSVELHETIEENGMARMRPLEDARIPAGGSLEMRPGGAHMMLTGLAGPLRPGERIRVTLSFERAGAVELEMEIMPIGAQGPGGEHAHH